MGHDAQGQFRLRCRRVRPQRGDHKTPPIARGPVQLNPTTGNKKEGASRFLFLSAPLFGLDAALDPEEQATREAGQMAAHCDALPDHVLPGMVEAQRLRDAALSRAIVAAILETDGGPVAVITGNGHARTDWGIPPMLTRALP